jgi:small-conductance mechanosensitive channel
MRFALAAFCALVISLSAALAFDQALLGQSDRALQQFRADLDRMEELLRRPALGEKDLLDTRSALETLRTSAAERSATLAAPLAEVNQQIASLGAPPEQGASEDAGVAKARADLNATRDRLQSLKSQFDVIAVEAEQNAGRVAALQRDQFFERVFDRAGRSSTRPSGTIPAWASASWCRAWPSCSRTGGRRSAPRAIPSAFCWFRSSSSSSPAATDS